MTEETKEELLNEPEVIKLEKNSKGYNWTLKIYPIPLVDTNVITGNKERVFKLFDTDISRLKLLNDRMMREFGSLKE